ncbi:MAG: 30S ribosomal protein S4e [Candidatus Bathyarchaeota archaeon]|nr:30S ribosomal protein S4e [Candidatus Bathyarchaeota archaeon]
MGKKGGSVHLKREAAPDFWPIHRKEFTWAVRPRPGPHPVHQCVPLVVVVREVLGLARTRKEAKKIISQGKILVDGKVRRDERFPAGLMDVVSIPELAKHYRILPSEKGLFLHPIGEDEAKFKMCRIENKRTVNKGHVEINLHDGRNILIHIENPQNPEEDAYRTMDTLKINIPDQEIVEHLKFGKGMLASFVDGNNIGKHGTITSIEEQTGQKRRNFLVTIKDAEGETFQTILNYTFVVGEKAPSISLPGTEDQ